MLCGLLTTGVKYVLFTREYINCREVWRQSEVIDASNAREVAALLLFYVESVKDLMNAIDTLLCAKRFSGIALDENPDDYRKSGGSDGSREDAHDSAYGDNKAPVARQLRTSAVTREKGSSKATGKAGAQRENRRALQDVVYDANVLTTENLLMHQRFNELFSL